MGKSPGQWIKTLLSGKKSARFHAGKGRDPSNPDNDKEYNAGEGAPVAAVSAPVISGPILVSTNHIGVNPTLEEAAPSNLGGKATSLRSIYQDGNNQGVTRYVASNDPNNFREEHAAIKAQAAFRGYLARKAFHALKGIIRLQALCRRHLVRRQAVATLYAMEGIVRLQAIVRGQVVRHSTGHEISTMFGQAKTVDAGAWKLKFSTNTFVSKLLSPSLLAKPLQINYDQEDSNSVCSWLGRWTTTSFWKPHYHAKKVTDSKAQSRRGNYAMETESARSKRTLRRNLAVNTDFSQTNVTSEPEKKKYNLRKITSSPAESVQDPKSDLQKVKRNLRKLSNPIAEASDQLVTETEKPKRSMRNVASTPSEIPFQGIEESIEQKGDDVALTPEIKLETEIASKSLVAEGPVEVSAGDLTSNELELLQQIDNEVNTLLLKEELGSKEEVCNESQKTSKRRFSFSEKSEHAENGLPKTTALPGYMAATESAKAKLRGLTSPRSMSDSVEQNGYTLRHSLPSSTNGKLSSHSPCTQRLAQPSGRSGIRSQKSLFSSRDSNERAIQVEWRR